MGGSWAWSPPATCRRAGWLCRRGPLFVENPRPLGFNPQENRRFLPGSSINPALGLTDYCWAHSALSIASYHESKCHASAVQSCPASCVRGLDGDFGRWAWRLPDHVRHTGVGDVEG